MSNRKELLGEELGKVAGGVSIDNKWGDGSVYKCCKIGKSYTHTFDSSRYSEVEAKAAEFFNDSSLSWDEANNKLWDWMNEQPGLLTPISK